MDAGSQLDGGFTDKGRHQQAGDGLGFGHHGGCVVRPKHLLQVEAGAREFIGFHEIPRGRADRIESLQPWISLITGVQRIYDKWRRVRTYPEACDDFRFVTRAEWISTFAETPVEAGCEC
jgi:hypothetical protein